jgi:hypothetical protein
LKLYWRLQDIPELKPLSKAERTEVWVATSVKLVRDPVMWVMLVPLFLVVALGNYLGELWLPGKIGTAVGGGIASGLAAGFLVAASYGRCRPHLAAEVRRRASR